jgi:hypothetical protein
MREHGDDKAFEMKNNCAAALRWIALNENGPSDEA